MPRSRKYDGVVYRRKETPFWWIRYRDRSGATRRDHIHARLQEASGCAGNGLSQDTMHWM